MWGFVFSTPLRASLAVFTLALFVTSTWAVAQEKVLYSFNPDVSDGYNPQAPLIADGAGNLYGTASEGGVHNYGVLFKLSPRQGGGYAETALHSFGRGSDGRNPLGGLVFDHAGNLYGTSEYGGIHGGGTVFELSPNGSGGWTETVLHNFGNGSDGYYPFAGLIVDSGGNLYGTTEGGGVHSGGTAFELSPRQGGGYTETVLHSFGNGTDGYYPEAGLVLDAHGNLYGTTESGGTHSCSGGACGTVFELSPRQGGGYTETVLHNFGNGTDGYFPYYGSLIFDGSGNLYGTTEQGGVHGSGTAFELSPKQGGGYTETVLHSFGNGTDGVDPEGGLIFDTSGNLYSTTIYGGIHNFGTVFELSPRQGGGWTETVLRSFDGPNGGYPTAGLIRDSAGNIYGTTYYDGTYYVGTVFELSPNGSGGYQETVLHNFDPRAPVGAEPDAGLVFDSAGNLYGTTIESGTGGNGTVFELSPGQGEAGRRRRCSTSTAATGRIPCRGA